jgi:hypothetical protein
MRRTLTVGVGAPPVERLLIADADKELVARRIGPVIAIDSVPSTCGGRAGALQRSACAQLARASLAAA